MSSIVNLGELIKIRGGGTPDRQNPDYWGGNIPWASVKDLKDLRLENTQEFITQKGVENSATNVIPARTVIVATRMAVGKACVTTLPVAINQDLKALFCSPKLLPQYLLWFLTWSSNKLEAQATGATVKGIKIDALNDLKIPLPPLEEQRRIAAILDKADAVRRKRQKAIALTEELLRSAFLEMFGDPVTNPKGWEVVSLGNISKIQGGLQVTSQRNTNPLEAPYLRVANVYRDQLVLDEIKLIRVTQQELERTTLHVGDLLIVEGHGNNKEIGRSSVWDGSIPNCTHQNHLIRVRLDSKRAEPTYISAFLNSPGGRRQLNKFGKTTSGLNTISTSNVKATKVLLPPLSEQKKYLEVKQKIAKCLGSCQEHFHNTDNLFNSLLQRAFQGKL